MTMVEPSTLIPPSNHINFFLTHSTIIYWEYTGYPRKVWAWVRVYTISWGHMGIHQALGPYYPCKSRLKGFISCYILSRISTVQGEGHCSTRCSTRVPILSQVGTSPGLATTSPSLRPGACLYREVLVNVIKGMGVQLEGPPPTLARMSCGGTGLPDLFGRVVLFTPGSETQNI